MYVAEIGLQYVFFENVYFLNRVIFHKNKDVMHNITKKNKCFRLRVMISATKIIALIKSLTFASFTIIRLSRFFLSLQRVCLFSQASN
jgi:hypothetical protein